MRKGTSTGLGVGASSILMIFIVLCITTFAVLSITSAGADSRLTDKAAGAVSEYYAADSKAEAMLYEIDDALLSAQTAPESEYLAWCADNLSALGDRIIVDTAGVMVAEQPLSPEAQAAAARSTEAAQTQAAPSSVEQAIATADTAPAATAPAQTIMAETPDSTLVVSYNIPISEGQELFVQLSIPKRTAGSSRYVLTRWQAVATGDWQAEDDTLPLWQGAETSEDTAEGDILLSTNGDQE